MDAHLSQGLGLGEALHARIQHELQDGPLLGRIALIQLADEHDRVGIGTVGDERLGTRQQVAVSVSLRRRLHRAECVGSRARLGDGPCPDLVEAQQVTSPSHLLVDCALRHDCRCGQPHRHAHRRDHARAHPTQLDDGDQRHRRVARCTLGRHRRLCGLAVRVFANLRSPLALDRPIESVPSHLIHAEGGEQPPQQVIGREVAKLQLVPERLDLGFDVLTHRGPDHLVLVIPLIHLVRSSGGPTLATG